MTKCSRLGAAILIPSTAESTEIAGVMIPSPNNNPAANMSRNVMGVTIFPEHFCKRLNRANEPPSPSESAISTNIAYLILIKMMSNQKIRLAVPATWAGVIERCQLPKKTSLNA